MDRAAAAGMCRMEVVVMGRTAAVAFRTGWTAAAGTEAGWTRTPGTEAG